VLADHPLLYNHLPISVRRLQHTASFLKSFQFALIVPAPRNHSCGGGFAPTSPRRGTIHRALFAATGAATPLPPRFQPKCRGRPFRAAFRFFSGSDLQVRHQAALPTTVISSAAGRRFFFPPRPGDVVGPRSEKSLFLPLRTRMARCHTNCTRLSIKPHRAPKRRAQFRERQSPIGARSRHPTTSPAGARYIVPPLRNPPCSSFR
jgi:hypothetical protein